MTTNRLEAFSDGVLAIAITLLVLDLKVPDAGPDGLWSALTRQWPAYAAYLTSFLVIGIMWINHHAIFRNVRQVDRTLLFLNLLLLMFISVIPFPTSLAADYLTQPGRDGNVAMAVYSGVILAVAIGFTAVWGYAVSRPALLEEHVDVASARRGLRRLRFNLGSVAYAVLVGVAFVSPVLCLAGHLVLAVYYLVDQLQSGPGPAHA